MFVFSLAILSRAASSNDSSSGTSGTLGTTGALKNCQDLLTAKLIHGTGVTRTTIGYLAELIHKKTIGDKNLNALIASIDQGRLANPIDEHEAETNASLLIHRMGIERLFNDHELDLAVLRAWAVQALVEKSNVKKEQDQTRSETRPAHRAIEWVAVPGRKFTIENPIAQIELTHPIEVMSTTLTQRQWADLFGENPAFFKNGGNVEDVLIKSKKIKMQPDHPVEYITWWSAVVAANKLSELKGLPPTYNLSRMVWKTSTRAEDGSLVATSGELQINAPGGDIYQAIGFRLPTEAEQENLLQLEEKQNSALETEERAWSIENSDQSTRPVGQLAPLILGSPHLALYDLIGNVWQWSHDAGGVQAQAVGRDPVNRPVGESRSIRGGAWAHLVYKMAGRRNYFNASDRFNYVGVRFVRTVPRREGNH